MILACPECDARFRVPDEAVGAGGRRVRCGACGHIWRAQPQTLPDDPAMAGEGIATDEDRGEATEAAQGEDEPTPATPVGGPEDPPEEPETPPADAAPPQVPQPPPTDPAEAPYGSASVPALVPGRRPVILVGWAAWLLFVIGIAVLLIGFRPAVESAWPPVSGLYEALGLSDHPAEPDPATMLEVRFDPEPLWEAAGENWTLAVTGSVTNRAAVAVTLPPLTVHLTDAQGTILRRAPVALEANRIGPGATLRFSLQVPDTPGEVAGLSYAWKKETAHDDA